MASGLMSSNVCAVADRAANAVSAAGGNSVLASASFNAWIWVTISPLAFSSWVRIEVSCVSRSDNLLIMVWMLDFVAGKSQLSHCQHDFIRAILTAHTFGHK